MGGMEGGGMEVGTWKMGGMEDGRHGRWGVGGGGIEVGTWKVGT